MSKLRALNDVADQETVLHLASRSHLFVEAAIASLLDIYTPAQAATVLRAWAEQLEQYG